MIRNSRIAIFMTIFVIFVALVYIKSDNLERIYIVIFHKTTTLVKRNNKSQYDGIFVKYVDGNVEIEGNFKNGLKDGWFDVYYTNGKLENKLFYKNDKAQGLEYEYYNTGKLNYTRFWKDGKQYGSILRYSKAGELESYSAYDILERNFFDYQYNSFDEQKQFKGFMISTNFYSLDEKNDSIIDFNYRYHGSDQFQNIKDLYITVATPPNFKPSVEVKINEKIWKNLEIFNNTVEIKNAFTDKKPYNILIVSHLLNEKNVIVNGLNIEAKIIKD